MLYIKKIDRITQDNTDALKKAEDKRAEIRQVYFNYFNKGGGCIKVTIVQKFNPGF